MIASLQDNDGCARGHGRGHGAAGGCQPQRRGGAECGGPDDPETHPLLRPDLLRNHPDNRGHWEHSRHSRGESKLVLLTINQQAKLYNHGGYPY